MAMSPAAAEYLRRLRSALEEASDLAETEDPDATHASTWFTDNVVIGTPVSHFPQDQEGALLFTFLKVSYLFLALLRAGFLGRGGIAFGPHYMDDRFVFGPTLIEAAKLEKDTGHPRVALTADAAAMAVATARGTSGYQDPRRAPHLRCLAIDEGDGAVFVDPIGVWLGEEDDPAVAEHFLEIYRQRIEEGIKTNTSDPAVLGKWQWLADYFSWAIGEYGGQYRSAPIATAPRAHRFRQFHEVLGLII